MSPGVDNAPAPDPGPSEHYRRQADLLAAALTAQRRIASADFDLDAVMSVVVENLSQLTGGERAAIALADEDGQLRVAAERGMAPGTLGRVLTPGESPTRHVFDTGISMLSGDLSRLRSESSSLNRSASGIAVPLEHHGVRLGVLACSSARPSAFTIVDVQSLELLAGIVGPAIAQAREVQRRRQVEAELRASQARLTGIVETMAEGVLVLDAEGVISFANPAAERMLKRPRGSLVGRDLRGARIRPHHLDGRPMRDGEWVVERLRTGEAPIVGAELRFLRPDRSFLDATVNAAALRDGEGEATGFVISINDSTERRRLESIRRESEERLRTIVRSAFDGIVAFDTAGRIIEFNAAAESLFGRSRAEVIGQPVRILLPARLRARFDRDLDRHRANPRGEPWPRVESAVVRGDGVEVPVEVLIVEVAEQGRTTYVASVRDLTDRAHAESARRESDAKSRFLAAMSHELRTPLNAILGFSQLLQRGESGGLTERQGRYVEHIQASGRHLLGLINDVLDLTKVAAGEMRVELVPVDLSAAVAEAVAQLGPLADERRLKLDVRVDADAVAQADSLRLSQVLGNLLSNAVKFTEPGGSVTVRGGRQGDRVQVSVRDTGIGIPADRLEEIFGEFTQVESTLSRAHDGTGLGLALTRRLVGLMGGTISVESELGRGSRFLVTLPALSLKPPEIVVKT